MKYRIVRLGDTDEGQPYYAVVETGKYGKMHTTESGSKAAAESLKRTLQAASK